MMTEIETVFKILDTDSIFTWVITQENSLNTVTIKASNVIDFFMC
jgi:hypothetical protein